MSTPSSCDTAGAGPSAAMRLDGGRQEGRRPAASSAATATRTNAGSGPKRAAHSGAGTVWPDPTRASSWAWLRTVRPKLRKTVVEESAGPRGVDLRIASARVGVGISIAPAFSWEGLGWGVLHPTRPSDATRINAVAAANLTER